MLNQTKSILKGKKIIGYGAGLAALATLRKSELIPEFFIDDTIKTPDQNLNGIKIFDFDKIYEIDKNKYVIIIFSYNPTAIIEITKKLVILGYIFNKDIIDCSLLHYRIYESRLIRYFNLKTNKTEFDDIRNKCLQKYIYNRSSISGTWLICELYKYVESRNFKGDIAELGVYKGGFTKCFMEHINHEKSNREYYLFDSFEGLKTTTHDANDNRNKEFSDADYNTLYEELSNYKNTQIVKGQFKDSFRKVANNKFSMVYFDADLYDSTIDACNFFYDRLIDGGFFIFHDYSSEESDLPSGVTKPFSGVKRALDMFLVNKPENLYVFPETTHAFFQKI